MSLRKPWRVGWSDDGKKYHFRAPSGYSTTLSGRNVGATALKLLPAWLDVARAKPADGDGDPTFIAAIEEAIASLKLTEKAS
jgi:hypothetical protein